MVWPARTMNAAPETVFTRPAGSQKHRRIPFYKVEHVFAVAPVARQAEKVPPNGGEVMTIRTQMSRRHLLKTFGTGVGLAVGVNLVDSPFWFVQTVKAAPAAPVDFMALADVALEEASALGCSYADIQIDCFRVVRARWPSVPGQLVGENRVPAVIESTHFGLGVRVIQAGDWGLAAGRSVEHVKPYEVLNLTVQAVASAQASATLPPDRKDRFGMPLDDWLAFWRTLDGAENRVRGVSLVHSDMTFRVVDKFFASNGGRRTHTVSTVAAS